MPPGKFHALLAALGIEKGCNQPVQHFIIFRGLFMGLEQAGKRLIRFALVRQHGAGQQPGAGAGTGLPRLDVCLYGLPDMTCQAQSLGPEPKQAGVPGFRLQQQIELGQDYFRLTVVELLKEAYQACRIIIHTIDDSKRSLPHRAVQLGQCCRRSIMPARKMGGCGKWMAQAFQREIIRHIERRQQG
ncbi:hypothetical protein AYM40_19815 [Paraburkholderia phytofirmans OLGA172]|uniref:Uncharacterized protein n=1 Tax=Paraburkholderia phytofirmans OLGA172 TaxID=1417228 RepID=A0A160FPQ1_9BURK|nr:hypothetical protein AYM40_19815 [Paraburkholderia phytofirmans OLGA172]